ncbi:putative vitellogenin receptor [Amphibalanus amphitrite]|uniref:putative vitellogenin receptor n=1 Tax=Amphibalanus amphitrite TaxID=1232801 RepID=UPI001C917490|nr:putative vitellogenin receptor [Amphibalanus amphitrite]XP_043228939.1 putative vitellogenin receptor [Amphibalanus amphitrite]
MLWVRCALVLVSACGRAPPADAFLTTGTVAALLYSNGGSLSTCDGDGEFLCTDGKACIPAGQRCDGSDDCGDGSDEQDCPPGVEPTEDLKSQCLPPSIWCGRCIPSSWRCDGEQDCNDGSDERDCPSVSCQGGFKCDSGHCVHISWLCDRDEDCPDGSDERNCTESRAADSARCRPGQFRCSDGAGCIPAADVCDGRPQCSDGSDEGTGCARRDTCSPATCTASQTCRPTPAGGHLCLCPEGAVPDSTGGCLSEGSCVGRGCEYDCQPSGGCVCPPGLQLGADNRTCELAADSAEPELLLADGDTVRQLAPRSRRLHTLAPAGDERVLAVTGELATRTAYWGFRTADGGGGVRRRADFQRAPIDLFLMSGVRVADALAWEWVARVLYLADAERGHLAACDWLGHCAVLVRPSGRLLALAVYPQQGFLFWSEISEKGGQITRAVLDGADAAPLPLTGLETPRSLAVDPAARRLYWTDTSRRVIESCLLDGSDRREVPELLVRAPFSLTVLGSNLFWSDLDSEDVHVCNKYTGKNRTSVYKRRSIWSFRIAALHASLQPALPNACVGSRCSHLCLPSQTSPHGHRCFCSEGERLGHDGFTCHPGNASQVVLAGSDLLLDVPVGVLGGVGATPIEYPARMVTAVTLDWLPVGEGLNLTLLYADSADGAIHAVDLETRRQRTLVSGHLTTVVALATDPVRGNVYWADSSRGTIELASFDGSHRRLIADGLRHLTALAVSASERLLFLSLGGRAGSIQQMELDGSRRRALVSERLQTPSSLAADDTSGRLFWADAQAGAIESIRYDGTERRALKRFLAGPLSVAVTSGRMFWSDMHSWRLHWVQLNNIGHQFAQSLGEAVDGRDVKPLLRLAAVGVDRLEEVLRLRAESRCPRLHCAELCLHNSERGEQCDCGTGRQPASDGRSCAPAACSEREFACQSGTCLEADWRCDGSPDCPGGEDEADCPHRRIAVCGADEFNCTSGECLSSVLRCDGTPHCSDASDEDGCADRACDADQFRCGTGYCVPAHYRCDRHSDCTDGSDEAHCGGGACSNSSFTCVTSRRCVAAEWFCDGHPDCVDLSDEPADCQRLKNCTDDSRRCDDGRCVGADLWCDGVIDCADSSDEGAHCGGNGTATPLPPLQPREEDKAACEENQRACVDGRCLSLTAFCDGTADCEGGEDELGCGEPTCPGTERRISAHWLCDGERDCEDGWDEAAAQCDGRPAATSTPPPTPACADDQFACADGFSCLSPAEVCDGVAHCGDRSDEGGMCETACSTHICAHRCRATPTAPVCGCLDGFQLQADGKTCRDVDECATGAAPCWQLCNNTEGGFRCGCLAGYGLEPDGVACRANTSPRLLLTQASRVIADSVRHKNLQLIYRNDNTTLAFSDYDAWTETLYFYDSYRGAVLAVPAGDDQPPRTVVANATGVTAMALEWATKSVYLASREGETGVLRACAADGLCRTLARTAGETLLALRPVPEQGFLLACAELAAPPGGRRSGRVLRLSADGSERLVLADHKVGRCGGVDLDRTTGLVWWSDTHFHRLGSARLDGSGRAAADLSGLHLPRGLAVFEDWAYVISHRSQVRRCHTRVVETGTGTYAPLRPGAAAWCQRVYNNAMELRALDVLHRLRQPLLLGERNGSVSACRRHGRCRHMCLPRGGQVACYCPDSEPDCRPELTDTDLADGAGEAAGAAGAAQPPSGGGGSSGAAIGVVLCLLALLLVGAALWLRRRGRRCGRTRPAGHQFQNPTFGMTPPPDAPDLGAPGAWLRDSADDNNNPFSEEDDYKKRTAGGRTAAQHPDCSPKTKSCHIQLGLGARSEDSGFLELSSAGFSSMERLVQ